MKIKRILALIVIGLMFLMPTILGAATKNLVEIFPPNKINKVRVFEWTALANGDDGAPLIIPSHADKTFHIKGTFGSGGTVVIEGSNDLTSPSFVTLTDSSGSPASVTQATSIGILQNPYQIRPRVTAGDGTTAITVRVVVKE